MKCGLNLVFAALVALLAGCMTNAVTAEKSGTNAPLPAFSPSRLAKTDIDLVSEQHERELFASLKTLAVKLYKRNPREVKKGGWAKADDAIDHLFGRQHNWRFAELEGKFGSDAIQLAFMRDYAGDRVFAFIAGIGGMVLAAFNDRYEFFMTDDLDAQKLYNAARNIEIAAWKLAQTRAADNELLLLSNEPGSTTVAPNLSFEREFGKMIGNLDLLSNTIADKTNRTVVRVVQSMATAVFLPVAGIH